jgi:ectoine hydroxylase-related dioxygenase (phytanoyl-CoA dioxygenase family)
MSIGPPPATDFEVDVSDDQVEFFREHGYLAIDRMTTDEEVEWLRRAYDEFEAAPRTGFPDQWFDLARPYGTTDAPELGQLLLPERRMSGFRDTALYRNGRRIAAELLDVAEPTLTHWGHLMFKPPRIGAATPWHQDEAYWSVDLSYHAVGAWTPVDDTDVDNGCLWFVPGSHKGDVFRHRHLGDDPAVHVLEFAEDVDVSAAVPVPLRAGGTSFHHPRTIHGARPNSTDRRRRAWANEYQVAPIKLDEPADRPWVKDGHDAMKERMAASA